MRRKRLIGLVLFLPLLLLGGDFIYWRVAVNQLRSGFNAWTARARSNGWDITHGAIVASGWPNSAMLRIQNFAIDAPGAFGRGGVNVGAVHFDRLTWSSDAVVLRSGLAQPEVLEITPVGPRPIRLNSGRPIPFSADHMHLRLAVRLNGQPRTLEFDAVAPRVMAPGFGEVSAEHLNVRAEFQPSSGRDQPAVTFSFEAEPVTLPDNPVWALGREVETLAFEGVLNGPLPPPGPGLTARATSWRDEGGSLEFHRVAVVWGKVRLDATATMALDDELQPMGAGTGKITGYGAGLDALAANGVVTRSAATAAKAVLSLLADTPAEGEPEEVEVPITLQFRTLSVRQVPLLRLPELDWPEP